MEEDVADGNPGDSDEEGDEIVAIRAQNDESELKFQENQAVFEKMHNSVVGHQGVDRTHKALKLRRHN